ncbi:P-loop containing nucleoside triphosphate hydrolase protein, partial [Neoconidiobolus thromboides FSU 785]
YSFDKIFQYQNQRQIYQGVLKPYINNMLEGYNLTLFTYGQTSTGKTYTLGTSTEHQEIQKYGLIQNFIIDLLPKLKEYSIKIQFLEVYNEKVKDLLYNFNSQDNVEEEILIRQDKNGNIIWYNAKEFQCHNLEEILDCLKFGIENRATGSTNKNHISSRSHAIFSLQLFNTTTKVCSKLNFVDLAGSERITKTGAVDLQLKEGIFINSGLLALGNVINALSVKSKNKKNHIPYRDSKLTRLLQDSLGEKNMMIMVACINNNRLDYHETLNTLNYATRAKKIQLNPHKNKIDDAYQDKQLIAQLKDE